MLRSLVEGGTWRRCSSWSGTEPGRLSSLHHLSPRCLGCSDLRCGSPCLAASPPADPHSCASGWLEPRYPCPPPPDSSRSPTGDQRENSLRLVQSTRPKDMPSEIRMSQQWMLCSEWVPSEWESDKNITIIHTTPVHQLTSGEDKSWNKSSIKTFITQIP